MKKIMTPEVALINLDTNDILTTSLNMGADPTKTSPTMQTPARPAVFDAPAAQSENNGGIW